MAGKEQVSENSDLTALLPFLMKSFFPQKTSEIGSETSSNTANLGPLMQILQQMNPDLVASQAQAGVNFQTDRLLQANFAPYLSAVNTSGGYNTGNQFLAQLIAETAGQGAKLATDARLEAGKTSEAAARDVATNTRQTSVGRENQQIQKSSPDLKSLGTSLLLSTALKKGGSYLFDKKFDSAGPEQLSGPSENSANLGGIAEGHGGSGISPENINSGAMTDQAFGAPGTQSNPFSPDVIPAEAFSSTSPEASSAAIDAASVGGLELGPAPGAGTASFAQTDPTFSESLNQASTVPGDSTPSFLKTSNPEDSQVIDSGSGGDVITGGDATTSLVGSGGSDVVTATGNGADLSVSAEAGAGSLGAAFTGLGLIDALSATGGGGSISHDLATDQDTGIPFMQSSQIGFTSYVRDATDPGAHLVSNDDLNLGSNGELDQTLNDIDNIAAGDNSSIDSVVCTEAVKQGLMSKELYEEAHQKLPGQTTINGYHFIATPIVLKMRTDSNFAKLAANYAIAYCEHSIGKKKSFVGFMLYWIARPICFIIGSIVGPQNIDEILYHG